MVNFMSDIPSSGVTIGKVIGYKTSWNPLAHESYVVVKVEDKKILVSVDPRQMNFIQKEYPVGSKVAVGFYGGAWHIGSKPIVENAPVVETGESMQDVIDGINKTGS